ncbi:MAG: putative immunity protein, partial [Anaerolineales bacterium]
LIQTQKKEKLEWANWLLVRCLNKKQAVQYAVFAAELSLPLFEAKYPDDDRPRKAIECAKAYVKKPCKKTKAAAWDAGFPEYDCGQSVMDLAADPLVLVAVGWRLDIYLVRSDTECALYPGDGTRNQDGA